MENLSQKEEIKAKAADYLDIVRSFSELLREENDALEKFETDKVAALYEQKVKLVTAYRSFVAFFYQKSGRTETAGSGRQADPARRSAEA